MNGQGTADDGKGARKGVALGESKMKRNADLKEQIPADKNTKKDAECANNDKTDEVVVFSHDSKWSGMRLFLSLKDVNKKTPSRGVGTNVP